MCKRFRKTPKEIADLTPHQQLLLVGHDPDELSFESFEDYMQWQKDRFKK